MTTLRLLLDEKGFNWPQGLIIYHEIKSVFAPGWGSAIKAQAIPSDHYILDKEFDDGYGSPQCPRFIAKDDASLYFPAQCYGATHVEKIFIDISKYLCFETLETPYP